VESFRWEPEHCEELRQLLAKGASYLGAADAINAKFRTCFTRSAAIGRARRMGIAERRPALPGQNQRPPRETTGRPAIERPALALESGRSEFRWPFRVPVFKRTAPIRLRCVEVDPRHLSLLELGRNDCRYPYGGDAEGDAITFCAHPRRKGSSYCTAHFHLTNNPIIPPELAISKASLRLVNATWFPTKNEVMEADTRGSYQTQEAEWFGKGS
jgi:GcrA cell cycle regulator